MAKSQLRGNREAKKPKQQKSAAPVSATPTSVLDSQRTLSQTGRKAPPRTR